jgi:hypothetical protein
MDPASVEKLAATMISEKRLAATIDQVDGMLDFNSIDTEKSGKGEDNGEEINKLVSYDNKVRDVCKGINATYDEINKSYPSLVKSVIS